MSQDGFILKGDKNLERDINKANSYEEIRGLLENAAARSGIAERDPQTGQFVRRNPLTPASQTVDPNQPEEKTFTKVVNIGGQDFEFSASSELELEQNIRGANEVASAARTEAARQVATASATPHVKTQAERERELGDRVELDLKFRRGELTTAEYLERTNAVGEYLQSNGVSVSELAAQSWSAAVETFLHSSDGADWPGGTQNLSVIGTQILSMGLENAEDKSAALAAAWAEMKKKQMVFETGPSEEQIVAETANMSPAEIMAAWREHFGDDTDAANAQFMRDHSNTRSSSSLFGK